MKQAIAAYHEATASDEFKELERLRALARHNEASALGHARRQGLQEGLQQGLQQGEKAKSLEIACNAIKMGLSTVSIVELTNLAVEEVMSLQAE